jgi:hypothetical protein
MIMENKYGVFIKILLKGIFDVKLEININISREEFNKIARTFAIHKQKKILK